MEKYKKIKNNFVRCDVAQIYAEFPTFTELNPDTMVLYNTIDGNITVGIQDSDYNDNVFGKKIVVKLKKKLDFYQNAKLFLGVLDGTETFVGRLDVGGVPIQRIRFSCIISDFNIKAVTWNNYLSLNYQTDKSAGNPDVEYLRGITLDNFDSVDVHKGNRSNDFIGTGVGEIFGIKTDGDLNTIYGFLLEVAGFDSLGSHITMRNKIAIRREFTPCIFGV